MAYCRLTRWAYAGGFSQAFETPYEAYCAAIGCAEACGLEVTKLGGIEVANLAKYSAEPSREFLKLHKQDMSRFKVTML